MVITLRFLHLGFGDTVRDSEQQKSRWGLSFCGRRRRHSFSRAICSGWKWSPLKLKCPLLPTFSVAGSVLGYVPYLFITLHLGKLSFSRHTEGTGLRRGMYLVQDHFCKWQNWSSAAGLL